MEFDSFSFFLSHPGSCHVWHLSKEKDSTVVFVIHESDFCIAKVILSNSIYLLLYFFFSFFFNFFLLKSLY